MEEISHFQYFVDLYWPWVLASLGVRVICWFFSQVVFWLGKSMGD